jgi:hypothetical protein
MTSLGHSVSTFATTLYFTRYVLDRHLRLRTESSKAYDMLDNRGSLAGVNYENRDYQENNSLSIILVVRSLLLANNEH